MAAAVELPNDVLHLIAGELAEQGDFSTLYRCAVSGSQFAKAGAIVHLYRTCHLSPVTGGGPEVTSAEGSFIESEPVVLRWAILWRSIILSSLDRTLLPYCQYMRVLDLRDFYYLLDDDKFRGRVSKYFFANDLSYLNITMEAPKSRKGTKRPPRLNARAIALAVGDTVTKHALKVEMVAEPPTPGLDLLSEGLARWAPHLQNLQSLQLGDGRALASPDLQDLIIASCPLLHKLEIYQWTFDDTSDTKLARFFSKLPANQLTDFQNESDCGIGIEACEALSNHKTSLKTLHLAVGTKGVPGLGKLNDCASIQDLSLTDLAPSPTPPNRYDLEDVTAWFKAMHELKRLTLIGFVSAPTLLSPALGTPSFQLDYLRVNGSERYGSLYHMRDYPEFHLSLQTQNSLTTLLLAAEATGLSINDTHLFCDTICTSRNLRKLNLTKSSETFIDVHLIKICDNLLDLEELVIDGQYATSEVLQRMLNLQHLKSLSIAGYSHFSYASYDAFVEGLGEGNRGIVLEIGNPEWDSSMSVAQQEEIRRKLQEKLDGSFSYQARGESMMTIVRATTDLQQIRRKGISMGQAVTLTECLSILNSYS